VCPYFLSGHCRRGKKCKLLHDKKAKKAQKKKGHSNNDDDDDDTNRTNRTNRNENQKGKLYLPKPYSGGEKGTLLKKLLEDEMFLEENLILQCLQYIVNNNFFDE
jgi:hypothetical protein